MTRLPVLEVGGTHVTAALVDMTTGLPVTDSVVRRPVPAHAGATEILDSFAEAARHIPAPGGAHWGVAIPGPFDYTAGVGKFWGIGKFEALHDLDVRAGLRDRLPHPRAISFLNDADAFALGEHHRGAAAGRSRSVCITLGTGVGSSFLCDGRPVTEGPTVPPGGRAHRISVDGLPLEEVVSRWAIRTRYARAAGLDGPAEGPDVSAIAGLARRGDRHAAETISECFTTLGRALAPWCAAFQPDVMVIGGSMARSFDLIGPALQAGLTTGPQADRTVATMELCTARRPDDAPLIGAAHWTLGHRTEGEPQDPVVFAAARAPGVVHRAARP
ncbi:Beta-glucoside kinase [Streptomyces sp. S4.7]|uniref:ROK family protein n=1 Tax=Streptomyces sp. S4.7 TaxID=2705439 RepID=UPI00139724B1|nr:ROK family protein [Streptomyces sp. S4.7]QHY93546.1 Beta-glucoside kinase [Streptomyces sp. S4.7]